MTSIKSTRISNAEGEKIWRETSDINTKKLPNYIAMDTFVSGKTGMKFTCKQDFDGYKSTPTMAYVRLFPASPVAAYQNMENRNSQAYWDRVAMKPQYKFPTNRTLFPREAFEQNRIEYDSLTIIQTGKLPKGMRYMVDWRYIGGIPPMRNGRIVATSYRRFVRPVPTSQCGSVCWFHMLSQATAFSRPAQLGERARIAKLGHVPYCPSAMKDYFDSNSQMHSRHDVCDAGLAQIRIYGLERNGCSAANSNQVKTWGKFTSAETFGLTSEGQVMVIPYVKEPNNVKFGVDVRGTTLNDDFSEPETLQDQENAPPETPRTLQNQSWGRSPTCFYKQPYTKNNIDTYFAQFVDKNYRISERDSLLNTTKPYLCHYNRILMCDKDSKMSDERQRLNPDPGLQPLVCTNGTNGLTPILKNYFVEGGNSWASTFDQNVLIEDKLRTNDTRLYKEVQLINGGSSYIGSTNGIPLFCAKNQEAHMTGELSRTSPVLYIMFMLDNYGPLGIHFGSLDCKKKKAEDPNRIVARLGGAQKSAHVTFYDLLIDGSGDTIDRMTRTLPDDLCPMHFNSSHIGKASGHSVALIGYKFIPSRPDTVLLIMYNSHDFSSGDSSMNRGIIVRRVPITSTLYGFNGVQPVPMRWNQHSLPMKYYYDGSEEVPLGAQGGTNEVRGGSAYDWTQTVDFDKSGRSLANKGDGTDGRHCGLGAHCTVATNNKTPYIYRSVQQSTFTKTSSRRILVTYGRKVACDDTPKTVSRNAAVQALAGSTGISFFVENPGASTVKLFLDVKGVVSDSGTGASVFAISVWDNDNEVFHDRVYDFHLSKGRTLPLCTPFSQDVADLTPDYTSIGSAAVCVGGTATSAADAGSESACGAACSKSSACDYFSYRYKTSTSSAQCFLGCRPTAFDFDKQVCDSVAYKKATDRAAHSPRVKVAGTGVVELENRFCKAGQQLFQDFRTSSFATCAQTCTSEKYCAYFTYNGSRCSVYAKCNLEVSDPYEYDYSVLGMAVPAKGQPVRLYANLNFQNVKTGQIPIEGDTEASGKVSAVASAPAESPDVTMIVAAVAFPLITFVLIAILIQNGTISLLVGGAIAFLLIAGMTAVAFFFM